MYTRKELNKITKSYNKNGEFISVPGYEWSGNTSVGGDHNVWYKSEGRPIFRSSRALLYEESKKGNDAHTSKELIKKLVGDGVLISTPAGSTAYNLSVHGPILSLDSRKLAVTPISPFRPRRWKGKILSNNAKI